MPLRRLSPLRAALAAAVLTPVLWTGCGGPQDPPPGPLGRHFGDKFLARLAIDARRDELAAKQAYDIALMEQAKAEADLEESRVQLDVARNERDAARLDERSAQSRVDAANQSADMNRVKEAEKELSTARVARDAAEKRFEYLEAYRRWLQRLIRFTQHNAFWKEAQFELAQARQAKKHDIQPRGFVLAEYEEQAAQRERQTQAARGRADAEKRIAGEARTRWTALQKQSDKLLGRTSNFADPMAPTQVKPSAGYTVGGAGGAASDQQVAPVQDPTQPAPTPPAEGGGAAAGDPGTP
jgi:hypothetical protein